MKFMLIAILLGVIDGQHVGSNTRQMSRPQTDTGKTQPLKYWWSCKNIISVKLFTSEFSCRNMLSSGNLWDCEQRLISWCRFSPPSFLHFLGGKKWRPEIRLCLQGRYLQQKQGFLQSWKIVDLGKVSERASEKRVKSPFKDQSFFLSGNSFNHHHMLWKKVKNIKKLRKM